MINNHRRGQTFSCPGRSRLQRLKPSPNSKLLTHWSDGRKNSLSLRLYSSACILEQNLFFLVHNWSEAAQGMFIFVKQRYGGIYTRLEEHSHNKRWPRGDYDQLVWRRKTTPANKGHWSRTRLIIIYRIKFVLDKSSSFWKCHSRFLCLSFCRSLHLYNSYLFLFRSVCSDFSAFYCHVFYCTASTNLNKVCSWVSSIRVKAQK